MNHERDSSRKLFRSIGGVKTEYIEEMLDDSAKRDVLRGEQMEGNISEQEQTVQRSLEQENMTRSVSEQGQTAQSIPEQEKVAWNGLKQKKTVQNVSNQGQSAWKREVLHVTY